MKDDDEALSYLARRGIEPGVVEVLRAMLAARGEQKAPVPKYEAAAKASHERRGAEAYPGNETDQKRKIRAAVAALWPDGIPELTGRNERVSHIREYLQQQGLTDAHVPSVPTVERELGFRDR